MYLYVFDCRNMCIYYVSVCIQFLSIYTYIHTAKNYILGYTIIVSAQ